jgi:hypothetical protein
MHRSLTLSLACVLVACEQSPHPTASVPTAERHGAPHETAALSPSVESGIARLRAITARFHRFDVAVEAGWSMPVPGCFSHPTLGGMGYHWGNADLIDGKVDELEPELLVYEPQKNGRLRLVAVEYIVPFTEWAGAEPPRLLGQSFHRNEGFGLWVLHVWHFRHNPSGIFADWNPTVSCEFAAS